jgi:hypothetical protein
MVPVLYVESLQHEVSRLSKKLAHRFLGPYIVERCVGANAYCLHLRKSMSHLHPVFPVVKLLTAPPDPIPGHRSSTPPDPVLIDGEEEYEVEAVINSACSEDGCNTSFNGRATVMNITVGKMLRMSTLRS